METLYYTLHNFNETYQEFEIIKLWQKNKKGENVLVSEIERDLDNDFSVEDELNFHVEDWEEETTYLFEELEEPTNVQFYLATYDANESDEQPYREVLAVFVDEIENDRYGVGKCFSCYAHLGQHSTCSQGFLREKCRKINVNSTEEYQDLKTELESIGYNLNIV